jgi:hypothetical protein
LAAAAKFDEKNYFMQSRQKRERGVFAINVFVSHALMLYHTRVVMKIEERDFAASFNANVADVFTFDLVCFMHAECFSSEQLLVVLLIALITSSPLT